nr:AlpA family phage regulatory protein [Rubellimicrobium mesophilum]
MAADQVLRLRAVLARTGPGRSTFYAMPELGEFVRPVWLSARAVGWRESDVATGRTWPTRSR